MRASEVADINFRDSDTPATDVAFWLRVAQRGAVAYDPTPSACYRVTEGYSTETQFLAIIDGEYAPTFKTVQAFQHVLSTYDREADLGVVERLRLRAIGLRNSHALLQAVVLQRPAVRPSLHHVSQPAVRIPTLRLGKPSYGWPNSSHAPMDHSNQFTVSASTQRTIGLTGVPDLRRPYARAVRFVLSRPPGGHAAIRPPPAVCERRHCRPPRRQSPPSTPIRCPRLYMAARLRSHKSVRWHQVAARRAMVSVS